VEIGDMPTPTRRSAPLFAQFALDVLGDSNVSVRNFRDWASIMLGCSDKHATLPIPVVTQGSLDDETDNPQEWEWLYADGTTLHPSKALTLGKTPWSCLPASVKDRLVAAYTVRVPWEAARLALPAWVPPHDVVYIEDAYKRKCSQQKKKQSQSNVTLVAELEQAA
jgi:hypothetical protein